jgi:RNA polymerase sigma-70 factor (ECF subfamily)
MSKQPWSASTADDFLGLPAMIPQRDEEMPEAQDIDALLMRQVAQGDEAAFEGLVKKYQKPLLNFFVRMGASSESEDLVQNTYVRLYQYRDRYQATAKFTTFLYALAYRVWADLGRKRQRRERLRGSLQTIIDIFQPHVPAAAVPAIDVETALATLSDKLRHVIVLHFYQGLPYQEIADVLHIPLGTVKSRINLAITALRDHFHETEDPDRHP